MTKLKLIEDAASQDFPESKEPAYHKLRITDEAMYKAILFAEIYQKEVIHRDQEIFGLLLNRRDKYDGIVRDVALAYEQDTRGLSVSMNPTYSVSGARNEDYTVIGMWHSHANASPFHSGPDKGTFESVYREVTELGEESVIHEGMKVGDCPIEVQNNGSSLELLIKANHPYKIKLNNAPDAVSDYFNRLNQIEFGIPSDVFYALSLVINNETFGMTLENIEERLMKRRNYYAEIKIQDFPNQPKVKTIENADIEIIHERNGIVLDHDALKEEILDVINRRKKPGSRKYRDEKSSIIDTKSINKKKAPQTDKDESGIHPTPPEKKLSKSPVLIRAYFYSGAKPDKEEIEEISDAIE